MKKSTFCSVALLLAGFSSLSAQTGVSLVAADYAAPASFEVAPGQVVTLFFRGVKPMPTGALRSGRAETEPLPTVMAGLSGRISQGTLSVRIPLFSVSQDNQCGDTQPVNPACVLTAIRVQVPFELDLAPVGALEGLPAAAPLARLFLEVDGQDSDPFSLQPVSVNGHILTTCDVNPSPRHDFCDRMAFHNDGQRITSSAPAKPGEIIVVYAFGLGPTWPAAETGKPSPSGAEVRQSGVLRVWTTVRNQPLNASPSSPRHFDADAMANPGLGLEFAGLAPGLIGVYQLNIQVPPAFDAVLPCGGEIRSNALALVTTKQGSEGVPFCVQP